MSIPLLVAALIGAGTGFRSVGPDSIRAPGECADAMTLRLLASGLYYRGAPPEGFRPTGSGLRSPETGEEIPIPVENAGSPNATARLQDARIRFTNIRTVGELPDGWRCAAAFTMEREGRTVQGKAEYTSEIDGLEYRVGGRFSIDGVEIKF